MTKSDAKKIQTSIIRIKSKLEKIADTPEGMRKIWDIVDRKTDDIHTDQDAINFLAYIQAYEIYK